VYVKKLPENKKNINFRFNSAISSCSAQMIKSPNPTPDLHYFEIYWLERINKRNMDFVKKILRVYCDSYRAAQEKQQSEYNRLVGGLEDGYVDEDLDAQVRAQQLSARVGRDNYARMKRVCLA